MSDTLTIPGQSFTVGPWVDSTDGCWCNRYRSDMPGLSVARVGHIPDEGWAMAFEAFPHISNMMEYIGTNADKDEAKRQATLALMHAYAEVPKAAHAALVATLRAMSPDALRALMRDEVRVLEPWEYWDKCGRMKPARPVSKLRSPPAGGAVRAVGSPLTVARIVEYVGGWSGMTYLGPDESEDWRTDGAASCAEAQRLVEDALIARGYRCPWRES